MSGDGLRMLWTGVVADSDRSGVVFIPGDAIATPFEAEIVAGFLRAELARLDELAARRPRFERLEEERTDEQSDPAADDDAGAAGRTRRHP